MWLRNATVADTAFIFECLSYLKGDVTYSVDELKKYLQFHVFEREGEEYLTHIKIGYLENTPIGMLTCNFYKMPRYLGIGCQVEEVIILEKFQGNGNAKKLIDILICELKCEPLMRKISINTDDKLRAGRAYSKSLSLSNSVTYNKKINHYK